MAIRWVTLTIVCGEPTFEWCDACQFSALAVFPLTAISTEGVGPFGEYRRCLHCKPVED